MLNIFGQVLTFMTFLTHLPFLRGFNIHDVYAGSDLMTFSTGFNIYDTFTGFNIDAIFGRSDIFAIFWQVW